jgi:hypothetical protein
LQSAEVFASLKTFVEIEKTVAFVNARAKLIDDGEEKEE